MITKELDLLERLRKAALAVDELRKKAKKIRERASRLDETTQSQMPVFSGLWTQDAIEVHLERMEEWVRTPMRAMKRGRLESLDIRGSTINSVILDDSDAIDEVIQDVQQILHVSIPQASSGSG